MPRSQSSILPGELRNPAWSTFNSLTGDPLPIWNVGIAAPHSPTEWPVLLTILLQAQHINCTTAGDGSKPIVTLDGDLYDRAVKLKDYKENWYIKLGALLITMAALKCLGKYIGGSGLDLAWEASGVYGSATVRQISDGRHIYRGLEAHMMTLLALHTLFQKIVFPEDDLHVITTQTNEILDTFKSYTVKGSDQTLTTFSSHVTNFQTTLSCTGVFQQMNEWNKRTKGIQVKSKFYSCLLLL